MTALSIVTTGGGVVGSAPQYSDMLIACPTCRGAYQMNVDPEGMILTPAGAVVLPGYTERCPICGAQHTPGVVLRIEGMRP